MREIRPSGSVEGVVGNHDPYSDMGSPPVSVPRKSKKPAIKSESHVLNLTAYTRHLPLWIAPTLRIGMRRFSLASWDWPWLLA